MERTVKMKRSDLAMAHNNLVKVISDIATSGEEKELTNEERLSVIKKSFACSFSFTRYGN